MASLNQFIVSGDVVLPPESRTFGDGRYMVKLRLGVEREKGLGENRQTVIEPVGVTFFCSNDEATRLSALEGSRLLVQGRIGGRVTEGKNGGSFLNTDLVGASWEVLSGAQEPGPARAPAKTPEPSLPKAPIRDYQDDIPF